VDEVAAHAKDFAVDGERPAKIKIVVAEHDVERLAELLEACKDARRADVAEVPDFVGAGDAREESRREEVVGV
jgi:hypothetical protein